MKEKKNDSHNLTELAIIHKINIQLTPYNNWHDQLNPYNWNLHHLFTLTEKNLEVKAKAKYSYIVMAFTSFQKCNVLLNVRNNTEYIKKDTIKILYYIKIV